MDSEVLPDELRSRSLPEVLLKYQARLCASVSLYPFVVCEKSRRIGATWGIAAESVLTAGADRTAGGMDVLYIGYNLDMAREFIDVCAMFLKVFHQLQLDVGEFDYLDAGEKGSADKLIKAFRIDLPSGFSIVALTSNPRSLRGRQGFLIFDEAAFHDNLKEMLKAAMAFLIWGGKVLVISTHDGVENPFNELILDIRSGKRKGHVERITFDDALADGLYERVALIARANGKSIEPKEPWVADIRGNYGEDADEELDVNPKAGGATAIPLAWLEAAARDDIPVLRYEQPDSFTMVDQRLREAETDQWLRDHLLPLLKTLPYYPSYVGQDFARNGDLSVIWPIQIADNLNSLTPFVLEMRKIPFEQQRQVLFFVLDHLPRFSGAALDAGGNGAYLAEVTRQKYGSMIEPILFSVEWYRDNMPRTRSAFEDRTTTIPKDRDTIEDFRQLRWIKGVIRVPERRTKGADGAKRHGDAAIAKALADYASIRSPMAYGYESASGHPGGMRADDSDQQQNGLFSKGAY